MFKEIIKRFNIFDNITKTENLIVLFLFASLIILIILSAVYGIFNLIINSLIALIGTLSGAFFGVRWKESVINKREEKKEKRQIDSVRSLITLEINQNLKSLKELWNKINEDNLDGNNEDIEQDYQKVNLSRKLIQLPLPNWKNVMWEDQTSLLAISLDEGEIKKIYDIYAALDDLKSIYKQLLNLKGDEKEQLRSKYRAMRGPTIFLVGSPQLWTNFRGTTLKLLKNGNPLESYFDSKFFDSKYFKTDKHYKKVIRRTENHYKE